MRHNLVRLCGAVSAAAVVSYAGTAVAAMQDGQAVDGSAQSELVDSASDNAPPEIIVTAQRRSERLQDVPISITAIDGQALAEQRVLNATDIQRVSPSIKFTTTSTPFAGTNIQIRGIGTTGNSRSFEGAVGVFIDGVYRTRSGQALQNFLDVESLQILRGPQGTLFGKNTSAGAMIVTSNAPSTSEVSGTYEVVGGNYDYYLLRGSVNVPLSDKIAVRVAALQTDHTGYFTNVNGGHDNEMLDRGVKGQLLLEPTDNVSVRLIVDYAQSKGNCCFGTVDAIAGPLTPFLSSLAVARGNKLPTVVPGDFRRYESWTDTKSDSNYKDYGGTLLADVDVGGATLRSITALRGYSVLQTDLDADYTGAEVVGLDEDFKSKFFSQEFTISGEFGSNVGVKYVAGLFYSNETIDILRVGDFGRDAQAFFDRFFLPFGLAAGTSNAQVGPYLTHLMDQKGTSVAGFAHGEFSLGDHWNIIAGLRYSYERKRASVDGIAGGDPVYGPWAILGITPVKAFRATSSDKALSGTFGIQYKFDRNAMIYATYNRGFKAGGVILDTTGSGTFASQVLPGSFRAVTNNPVYEPETVDALEGGVKITWLGGRATTNAAVFYNAIQDIQIGQFLGVRYTVLNAQSAKTYGAEFEQRFALSDEFTISAAGSWLPVARYGTDPRIGILSGRRFVGAPKFTGNISLSGENPVSSALALTSRFQLQYEGTSFASTVTNVTQSGYALLNMGIGLKSPSAGWSVEAFVNNLTDKRYAVAYINTPLQSGDQNAFGGAPRTFGLALRGSF
ncbi:TonB-dependent receptor [Sphingopyxis terrae]|uniref:TonB-dependent receptor n=1 Tax=Sphingopyxis terrae TaxID=33052 RepID=UPI002A17CCD9|nr:TonB-dependent receptor [Sphingopyxis terrae]MDX8356439.1 TonB-dependent receptor [Sphingopyxis terrae]